MKISRWVAGFAGVVCSVALLSGCTPPKPETVTVSPETKCRTVTHRAFSSLANGRITQHQAQARVDDACAHVPTAVKRAIIAAEKAKYTTP